MSDIHIKTNILQGDSGKKFLLILQEHKYKVMEVEGKIIQVMEPVTGQGKNGVWRKQEFVIETFAEYPKKICLTIWGDKINLANFPLQSKVKASIDVESREYNGRWYTDVKAWKLEKGDGAASGGGFVDPPAPENFTDLPDEDDALPF